MELQIPSGSDVCLNFGFQGLATVVEEGHDGLCRDAFCDGAYDLHHYVRDGAYDLHHYVRDGAYDLHHYVRSWTR